MDPFNPPDGAEPDQPKPWDKQPPNQPADGGLNSAADAPGNLSDLAGSAADAASGALDVAGGCAEGCGGCSLAVLVLLFATAGSALALFR